MSIKVQGNIVIDDSRNITLPAVQIYANGVIANVQVQTTPADNDAVNYITLLQRGGSFYSVF